MSAARQDGVNTVYVASDASGDAARASLQSGTPVAFGWDALHKVASLITGAEPDGERSRSNSENAPAARPHTAHAAGGGNIARGGGGPPIGASSPISVPSPNYGALGGSDFQKSAVDGAGSDSGSDGALLRQAQVAASSGVVANESPTLRGLRDSPTTPTSTSSPVSGDKATAANALAFELCPDNDASLITYEDAWSELVRTSDLTEQRRRIVPEDFNRPGALGAMRTFLAPKPKLKAPRLVAERDFMFCFALVPFDDSNALHHRILYTTWRHLMGSDAPYQRHGHHWDAIGFQGSDPATDLRGAGIFGLLQMLYLAAIHPKASKRILELAHEGGEQRFPFAVVSLNFTSLALQALRRGKINTDCLRRGNVLAVCNEFYAGIFFIMFREWTRVPGKDVTHFNATINRIDGVVRGHPESIFHSFRVGIVPKQGARGARSPPPRQTPHGSPPALGLRPSTAPAGASRPTASAAAAAPEGRVGSGAGGATDQTGFSIGASARTGAGGVEGGVAVTVGGRGGIAALAQGGQSMGR